jgi:hypothetical protein
LQKLTTKQALIIKNALSIKLLLCARINNIKIAILSDGLPIGKVGSNEAIIQNKTV